MSFTNLPSSLGDALAARGYTSFTSVQQAVLEPEAPGRALIVSPQTGTGKTVAFGLACAPEIVGDAERMATHRDHRALVLATTTTWHSAESGKRGSGRE